MTEVKTDIYVTSFGPVSDVEMVSALRFMIICEQVGFVYVHVCVQEQLLYKASYPSTEVLLK